MRWVLVHYIIHCCAERDNKCKHLELFHHQLISVSKCTVVLVFSEHILVYHPLSNRVSQSWVQYFKSQTCAERHYNPARPNVSLCAGWQVCSSERVVPSVFCVPAGEKLRVSTDTAKHASTGKFLIFSSTIFWNVDLLNRIRKNGALFPPCVATVSSTLILLSPCDEDWVVRERSAGCGLLWVLRCSTSKVNFLVY